MTPEITRAAEDYLKTIWTLSEWGGAQATTKALAAKLGVAPSTVSESVKRLRDQGLVAHRRYGTIELTDEGRRLAVMMVRRHRLIESFLVARLGYSWDEAHDEAEHLEHACSPLFIDRVDATLGFPARDPHGDPIPRGDGQIDYPDASLLADLPVGARAQVTRISDADADMLRYFGTIGLQLDTRLSVVARHEYAGTITIRIDDAAELDLGLPAARAVWAVPHIKEAGA